MTRRDLTRRLLYLALWLVIGYLLIYTTLGPPALRVSGQQSALGEMGSSGGTPLIFRAKNLNVNQVTTDIGTFTGLPARYIVRRLTFENCSATPTLATVDLRTATGGGGSAIVSVQALAALSSTTISLDATLAITNTVLTGSTLTLRAVAAAGSAATCDAALTVDPLL